MRGRHVFAEVVGAAEKVKGERREEFWDRHGDWGRDLVLLPARRCTGMTLRELGEAAGGMDYAAVGEAVRRMAGRRAEEPDIRSAFRQLSQSIAYLDASPISLAMEQEMAQKKFRAIFGGQAQD